MNIPLEAPCDRSDQPREPGDVRRDAAQRDLFEYFAPPVTETGAPPLAADFSPAAAPDAVATVEDEGVTRHNQTWHDQTWHDQTWHDQTWHDQTWHDQTWHDQILAWPDDIDDDEISHHEPESPDEIAAYDPGAYATHPEVAALDETSKANLRRLETTLSWMQNEAEACRLPPATPLPPIRACPWSDGSSTAARSIGHCIGRRRPQPGSGSRRRSLGLRRRRRGRVFWPRAVKFAMACVIAAPLAYYFAVTTSPLHEPLVEIAGVASLVSPVVRPPGRAIAHERSHAGIAVGRIPRSPPNGLSKHLRCPSRSRSKPRSDRAPNCRWPKPRRSQPPPLQPRRSRPERPKPKRLGSRRPGPRSPGLPRPWLPKTRRRPLHRRPFGLRSPRPRRPGRRTSSF